MVKPDFLKLRTWEIFEGEARGDLLLSAGLRLRSGEDPEPAFWNAAFHQSEEAFRSFFELSDGVDSSTWTALRSDAPEDRYRVFRILVELKAYAAEQAALSVNVDLKPIDFVSFLPDLPDWKGQCLYCGKSLKFGQLSNAENRLHLNCYQGWRAFTLTSSKLLQSYAESLHEDHRPPKDEIELDDELLSGLELQETNHLNIFHED